MPFESKIPGSRIVEKTFHGHKFSHVAVDRPIGMWDPSWWSFDDEAAIRDSCWNVATGDVIFDVGAAYGSYTCCGLACGAAFSYAWSPQGHPGDSCKEADFLRETLALNDWSDRVKIFEHGVYSKSGWVNARTQEVFSIDPTPTLSPTDQSDIVAVVTLDRMLYAGQFSAHPASDRFWMKIDVEGAEVEVLKGAQTFLCEFEPIIFVENHLFKDATIGDQVRRLLEMGELGVKYSHQSTTPYGSLSHSLYFPK